MSDGIHIPAVVVRALVVAAVVGLGALIWSQVPEARRYLKMESM
jgi:hypothetical protein